MSDAVEGPSEDSCTCGPDDACSACGGATSEVMDVPTFNQCEVHGKCVDETWTDDHGVSHATCLGPIPEHVRHRLNALRIAAEMDKRHPGWREQGRVPPRTSISDEAETVLKVGDITSEEGEAWNAYWATRHQWMHHSDVLPELRAFVAGFRAARQEEAHG